MENTNMAVRDIKKNDGPLVHRGRYNEPGTGGRDVYELVKKAKDHMAKR